MAGKRKLALFFLAMDDMTEMGNPRTCWVKRWRNENEREKYSCFHHLLNELRLSDAEGYRGYLRMDTDTFESILRKISPPLERDGLRRATISPGERLSLTLRYLATGETFRSLAFQFMVPHNTISGIVPEVLDAIYDAYKNEYLKVPSTGKEWLSIAHEFEEMWQFPQCLGALDGKHVPIIYPKDSGSAYFNYKGFYSIVMMAVVSADLSFIYVDAGTNGRQCDSSIWNASSLKKAMEVGHLNFPPDKPLCEGRRASPYVFVTDEGIGMSTRVLRPYAQKQLTHERRIFNYRLSRARRVVENAFGILYSVWRVFANTILLSPEKAAKVVLTCCVLHNMLRGRKVPSYVNTECGGGEGKQPAAGIPLQSFENGRHLNAVSSRAKIVRDEYASFFFNEGKVEWQWKHLQNT